MFFNEFLLLSGCMINNDDGSTWMIFKIYINANNLKPKHISIVKFIIFIDIYISYMCKCLNDIFIVQLLILNNKNTTSTSWYTHSAELGKMYFVGKSR